MEKEVGVVRAHSVKTYTGIHTASFEKYTKLIKFLGVESMSIFASLYNLYNKVVF